MFKKLNKTKGRKICLPIEWQSLKVVLLLLNKREKKGEVVKGQKVNARRYVLEREEVAIQPDIRANGYVMGK